MTDVDRCLLQLLVRRLDVEHLVPCHIWGEFQMFECSGEFMSYVLCSFEMSFQSFWLPLNDVIVPVDGYDDSCCDVMGFAHGSLLSNVQGPSCSCLFSEP